MIDAKTETAELRAKGQPTKAEKAYFSAVNLAKQPGDTGFLIALQLEQSNAMATRH